ncbi:MAG: hypothetical protein LBU70_04525 [Chitinispirillales bacterium]|nr:hypothetical protein [Chitinispirillales bacterium]
MQKPSLPCGEINKLRAKRGNLCTSAQATVFFEALANLFVEYLELQAGRLLRFARNDGF